MHRREYDVPYLFYELGLDVYFYQAPYHARRKPAAALVSGQLLHGWRGGFRRQFYCSRIQFTEQVPAGQLVNSHRGTLFSRAGKL